MNEITMSNNNLDLRGLYEDFIRYIDVSDLTIKSYKDGIKNFFHYMNERGIKTPTRENVREYRDALAQTKATNTINSYLCSLRVFFNYLDSRGLYPNITRDVKNIKTSKIPKKQVLSIEECKNIYTAFYKFQINTCSYYQMFLSNHTIH